MNPRWSIKCLVTLFSLWMLSVVHYRQRWRVSNSCIFASTGSHFPHCRDPVRVWALNISPGGVIHSGRATDDVFTARNSDCLSSNVKPCCNFQFNMQRSLKGMLYGAFVKWMALLEFSSCVSWVHPGSTGHLQVGARYERPSYPTSKLTGCCRISRCSAYCWLNIY